MTRPRIVPRINRRAVIVPLFFVTALVSLLYLSQTSDVATTGYDISDLQEQKQMLLMQNEQLRLQVAQLESLDRVDHEATTRLHMGPPQREVYVNALAIAIPTPAPTPVPSDPRAESPLTALWQSISGVTPPPIPTDAPRPSG